jgi:hypothetical protein
MDREFARLTRIDFVHFLYLFLIEFHDFFYLLSIMLFIFHDSDHEFDKLTQSIFLIPFQLNFFFNLTLQQLNILLIFFYYNNNKLSGNLMPYIFHSDSR